MTDGPSRSSRELIEAARRAYVPGPTAKARVRRNLDLKIAAVAAGAGGTLFGVTVAKALTVAAVATVAVGGGTWVAKRAKHAEPPRAAHVSARTEPRAVPMAPTVEPMAPTTPPLDRELALLFEAQQAIGAGAAARGLAALDRHAAEFPNGAMIEERTASRALALCALGRAAEAQSVARQFVSRWPSSPLVGRMKEVCASFNAPTGSKR
jgi:hypothetical protein